MDFFFQIYHKTVLALRTIPTRKSWIIAFFLLLVIILLCLPLGLWSNFLEVSVLKLSFLEVVRILVSRFFFPCLAEELIFRVLLLPGKNSHTSMRTKLFARIVSLTAYVAGHPLNAALFYQKALGVFTEPFFLLSTAILGIACTVTYLESGSIWTPVAVHWITVMGWLLMLGGYSKLGFI